MYLSYCMHTSSFINDGSLFSPFFLLSGNLNISHFFYSLHWYIYFLHISNIFNICFSQKKVFLLRSRIQRLWTQLIRWSISCGRIFVVDFIAILSRMVGKKIQLLWRLKGIVAWKIKMYGSGYVITGVLRSISYKNLMYFCFTFILTKIQYFSFVISFGCSIG